MNSRFKFTTANRAIKIHLLDFNLSLFLINRRLVITSKVFKVQLNELKKLQQVQLEFKYKITLLSISPELGAQIQIP